MAESFSDIVCSDKELIWQLDQLSLKEKIKTIDNPFWREVFICWKTYRETFKTGDLDYQYFPIWNSYFANIDGLRRMKGELLRNGLTYVKDLFKPDGTLMGYQDFIETYHVQINFIDYYSLIHNLERPWKAQMQLNGNQKDDAVSNYVRRKNYRNSN